MNEYLNVIQRNYANFSGRARRREYWMFTLVTVLIAFILGIVDALLFPNSNSRYGVLGTIYLLATFAPSLAVTLRRLHD